MGNRKQQYLSMTELDDRVLAEFSGLILAQYKWPTCQIPSM